MHMHVHEGVKHQTELRARFMRTLASESVKEKEPAKIVLPKIYTLSYLDRRAELFSKDTAAMRMVKQLKSEVTTFPVES